VRFEELGEFERTLLVDAYRQQAVQRLRALVGVPVCVAISAFAFWFFILGDDTGGGRLLGWPIVLVMGGIAIWMVLETVTNHRVRWALRGMNLQNAGEELLESMKSSPVVASERARGPAR
jgi:hypothetical protein